MWYVYMVRCSDDSLYTGIAKDLEKRISDHNISNIWAKYTRSRRPVTLVWHKEMENRNDATRLEIRIKKLSKIKKEELISMILEI
jgi:putative endonuclease